MITSIKIAIISSFILMLGIFETFSLETYVSSTNIKAKTKFNCDYDCLNNTSQLSDNLEENCDWNDGNCKE